MEERGPRHRISLHRELECPLGGNPNSSKSQKFSPSPDAIDVEERFPTVRSLKPAPVTSTSAPATRLESIQRCPGTPSEGLPTSGTPMSVNEHPSTACNTVPDTEKWGRCIILIRRSYMRRPFQIVKRGTSSIAPSTRTIAPNFDPPEPSARPEISYLRQTTLHHDRRSRCPGRLPAATENRTWRTRPPKPETGPPLEATVHCCAGSLRGFPFGGCSRSRSSGWS